MLTFFMDRVIATFVMVIITSYASVNNYGPTAKRTTNKCHIPTTYDYIIIGAGVSGSIVAAELSAEYSVLLIEEGGWSSQWDIINDGSRGFEVLAEPQISRGYVTTPQTNVFGRSFDQQRARITGGCGSHTLLEYFLGQREDFDSRWGPIDGWKWNDLEPFWDHISNTYNTFSWNLDTDPLLSGFVSSAQNNGYTLVPDPNDLSNLPNPADIVFINQVSGQIINDQFDTTRTSAWSTYIEPILGSGDVNNLDILVYTRVNKILFHTETKRYSKSHRAIGVETFGIGDKQINEFYARKEVILSAGAIDSPKILMLSGVGDCEYLNGLNIECIANVPAVGKNLEDHLRFGIVSPPLMNQDHQQLEPLGLFNFNNYGISVQLEEGKFRNALGIINLASLSDIFDQELDNILAFTSIIHVFQLHSRGEVLLIDNNPESPPIINPNYLSDPRDEDILIEAFRESRNLLYTEPLLSLYLGDENSEIYPGVNIDTDNEILESVKLSPYLESDDHQGSTCKMGNEFNVENLNDIVVNNKLQVRGVKNLRIIDHSIVPRVVSANTNQVSMIIGFKGSDIILNHDD